MVYYERNQGTTFSQVYIEDSEKKVEQKDGGSIQQEEFECIKTVNKVAADRTAAAVKEISANTKKSWGLCTGKTGKAQKDTPTPISVDLRAQKQQT